MDYRECLAKTFLRADGTTYPGRTVLDHCQIVGEVARELINRFPVVLANRLFPEGSVLAAAAHDIGKVSPYFVEKIRRACDPGTCHVAEQTNIDPALESQWGGHAGVSQLTARDLGAPDFIPEILGQHHGYSPALSGRRATDEVFGGPDWLQQRKALVVDLKASLRTDWPNIDVVSKARLVAGLTSVSDWIGSGELFEDPALPWAGRIQESVDRAGYVAPTYRRDLTFSQIFGFEPRPVQSQLIAVATGPGVYLLEAPMGVGKTEAALYAAYRVLERGLASGIYFALPTQLTSNKLHQRFNAYLDQIVEVGDPRSLLLHGGAWLLEAEMGEDARPGGAWFNHAKRGLLAPFGVGTVDQALMAAMNVKHGFVRAFGLAGKVVILDEVHTYDSYTGSLLDALIRLLRELQCTVIILTATLSRERRQVLMDSTPGSDAYPLVSASVNESQITEYSVSSNVSEARTVRIELTGDEAKAVDVALIRAAQGQQVLWIENTVVEAQQRYLDIAARAHDLNIPCGMLHSRFIAADRKLIEDKWVDLFGKAGQTARRATGRILVGTQVLEQSLDIDADFLVSRFAPTDMLLQRMGRLWRHAESFRPANAQCEAWLLAPDCEKASKEPLQTFGRSALVYSPYVLCRSLEVWHARDEVQLPGDIRSVIESTYAQRDEVEPLSKWLDELNDGTPRRVGRKALRQLAQIALSQGGNTLPEHKAQTRYSETESHEVLVVGRIDPIPLDQKTRFHLRNGHFVDIPWTRNRLSKRDWRQRSAVLMRNVVAVRAQDAPTAVRREVLEKHGLQHCFYLGSSEHDDAMLRIGICDQSGLLHSINGARAHQTRQLSYRDDLGYQVLENHKV